jgi:hypothetical protein
MTFEARSYLRNLVVYVCALVVLIGGSFLCFANVFYAIEGSPESREPTRLDINVQTAREIRRALDTAIPQPSPLGPITASRASPMMVSSNAAVMKPEKRKRSTKGLDAMAMSSSTEFSGSKDSGGTHPAYDRHALQ